MKIISGIKPTGRMHLGNYLGSFKHFKDYQEDKTPYIFVADLHALTLPIDPELLRKYTYDILAYYLASGLDENKTVLFKQSDIYEIPMLNSILINYIYMGELSRMTQFKQKSQKLNNESIGVGLFAYPVLMAADLYMYDADICPVGEDQVQHIELARDIAKRFNNRYKEEILKTPKPAISKVGARIKALDDPTKKMSKSDDGVEKGVIYLDDPINVSKKKIMSAVTDTGSDIIYDVENKPGISNLMSIYASLKEMTIDEVQEHFKDCHRYGDFKKEVAKALEEELTPFQERFNKYRSNTKLLDEIFARGAAKARESAEVVLDNVMKAVGLK